MCDDTIYLIAPSLLSGRTSTTEQCCIIYNRRGYGKRVNDFPISPERRSRKMCLLMYSYGTESGKKIKALARIIHIRL